MLVFHILQVMEKNFWFQRCLLLPEFPVLSAFLLPRGRLQGSTSGSGRGATAETELTLCPFVNFNLVDNLFLGCALGNSSFYAKAGNEIKAAVSWVRGAVVVARAQSHDQPLRQTGCQRQTGVLQDYWKLLLKLLLINLSVFNACSIHRRRSNGRGLTPRVFLLPLRIAPQRTSPPVPPLLHCNCLNTPI